jgi:hypothetical protein
MKKNNILISETDATMRALSQILTKMVEMRLFPSRCQRQFVLEPTPFRGWAWGRCRGKGANQPACGYDA